MLFLWLLLPLIYGHYSAKLKGTMCFISNTNHVWQIYSVTVTTPPSRHFHNLSLYGDLHLKMHKTPPHCLGWIDDIYIRVAGKCSWQQCLHYHFLLYASLCHIFVCVCVVVGESKWLCSTVQPYAMLIPTWLPCLTPFSNRSHHFVSYLIPLQYQRWREM